MQQRISNGDGSENSCLNEVKLSESTTNEDFKKNAGDDGSL